MKIIKNYRSSIILLISMAIGAFLGITVDGIATYAEPVADTFINLLFCLVVPLILFSTVNAISRMSDMKKLGKMLGIMFILFVIAGFIAAVFMSATVTIFNPAQGVTMEFNEVVDTTGASSNFLAMFTVNDFYLLFSRRSLMPLVVFALMIGIAMSSLGKDVDILSQGVDALEKIVMKLIGYVMKLAPLGIGSSFAVLMSSYGSEIAGPLSRSIVIYMGAAVIFYFGFHSVFAYVGGGIEGIRRLWKTALTPALTALGTCSSAASIPSNTIAYNQSGISEEVTSLMVPLGTNFHKDGAVMIQILKIAFMCSIYGINFLEPSVLMNAIFTSITASIVMGAIPAGGYVGELFIVAAFGFPAESIPIMVLIGTITDAPATAIHVTGDVAVAMIVEKIMNGKDWIKKQIKMS
jgi:Na+/H+-dicarboxylate symporters